MKAGKKTEITYNGKSISLYTILNKNGLSVDITNYGAKIVRLYTPDRKGNFDDIVLGFDTLEEYLEKETYFGAICGRFANRIKNGKFTIDGTGYELAINNDGNHLHGGIVGFNEKIWDLVSLSENQIVLHYLSPDGEENYPGNLDIKVSYKLTDENKLEIHYEATTDKATVIGLTQHSYFNLKGAGNGSIRDHILQLNADHYTLLDDSFSPTGEIAAVKGTALDFRKPTRIEERIDKEVFAPGRGLDNNWCIKKEQMHDLASAGFVFEPTSGRKIEILTTQPGIQIYTANWVDRQTGKEGKSYGVQEAICLETQSFPNAVNIAHFPSSILRPEEKYDEYCIYKFSVE